MNLHFFFEGRLKREEVASAFLATVLEQHAGFRNAFLGLIGDESLKACSEWEVWVEKDYHDIRLTCNTNPCVVIVENKLTQGAVQKGQLLRYYKAATSDKGQTPDTRVIIVLLSPTEGTGGSELDALSKHLRPSDVPRKLSWLDVAELGNAIADDDPANAFIQSGIKNTLSAIENATQEKYPLDTVRGVIDEIVKQGMAQLLARCPGTAMRSWRSKESHQVFTAKSGVTVKTQLVFKTSDEPPYSPVGVTGDKGLTLTLRTRFTLSALGRKDRERRERWKRRFKEPQIDVPGVGPHIPCDGRWFRHDKIIEGSRDQILAEFVAAGESVIRHTQNL